VGLSVRHWTWAIARHGHPMVQFKPIKGTVEPLYLLRAKRQVSSLSDTSADGKNVGVLGRP